VLAGTFGVLIIVAGRGPGSSYIRDIGVGLGLGILMDTFLVRTLLVPSTVVLLGRWNWWPSRMSREHVHPDSSGGELDGTTREARDGQLTSADPPSRPD
jgi:RND superfamily putative drug exporter